MWGTLILAAVVTAAGLYVVQQPEPHTPNGHKKPSKPLLLSINFSNAPRDPKVHIAYKIGFKPTVEDWTAGAWQEAIPVASGTHVELGAKQFQSGSLFCSIRQGERILDFDDNLEGQDWVMCVAVAP